MYKDLGKDALENRQVYCDKHGYELVHDTMPFDSGIAYNWMKFDAIERHLPGCDWLLWSDADSFILNEDITLESFTAEDKNIVCGFFKIKDFRGINPNLYTLHTGNFLVRNCPWSFEMLKKFKENMHIAIGRKEPMIDEYTLTQLYKNEPGYASKFKLLKIDKLFAVPNTKELLYMDLPIYKPGDFLVHYITPLTYSRKVHYSSSIYESCMSHWGRALPVSSELERNAKLMNILGC
jgi:hypothetical protein